MISSSVRIAASPEVVFPYFTDPRLMVTWIGERVDLDARPGGMFALDFSGVAARGTYVAVEPPHRVVFTWGIPEDDDMPPGSSTVEVVLVADGGDTIVNLTHRDLPPDREPSHRDGWDGCLGALVAAIRHDGARAASLAPNVGPGAARWGASIAPCLDWTTVFHERVPLSRRCPRATGRRRGAAAPPRRR